MKLTKVLLGAAGAVSVIYVGITVSLFRFAVTRKAPSDKKERVKRAVSCPDIQTKEPITFDKADLETVTATSFDGLRLSALFLPVSNARGTVILFHGFRSSPRHDFAASFPYFSSLGLNLLYPIQRAHGSSDGKFVTYGIKERHDAVRWTEFINERLSAPLPIYLGGISMGCTTALMGAGVGYPKNVRGIIADCGFISPYGIFKEIIQKSGLPPSPSLWLFGLLCRYVADFDIKEYSTLAALEKTDIPIAFIHGENDKVIKTKATIDTYNAYNGKKYLLTVKNAAHGRAYAHGKAEYEALIDIITEQDRTGL